MQLQRSTNHNIDAFAAPVVVVDLLADLGIRRWTWSLDVGGFGLE